MQGLEVIEAHYLFGAEYDDIEIVIHPQSIIHSMIETQVSPTTVITSFQEAYILKDTVTHAHVMPMRCISFILAFSSSTFSASDRQNLRFMFFQVLGTDMLNCFYYKNSHMA